MTRPMPSKHVTNAWLDGTQRVSRGIWSEGNSGNLAGIHPRFRRKLGFAGIAAKLLSAMPRKTQPRRVGFRLARGVPDEDSMGPVAPYQEAVGLHLLDRA